MSVVPWLERLSNIKNEELDPGLDPIRFFDDSGATNLLKRVKESEATSDGMNTSQVDLYRQGVEITRNKFRFMSTQPKFWAGNINHWVEVEAIGSPGDFTHFDNENIYNDLNVAEKWNPVKHLDDDSQLMMLFNEGQQQEFASSIEPLEIPGKKPSITDPKNPFTGMKGDNRVPVLQQMRMNDSQISWLENTRERFSDNGQGEQFSVLTGSNPVIINSQPWVDSTVALIAPYHDEIQTDSIANPLIQRLTNASEDIISVLLRGSNLDLDESSNINFEYRSATAGNQFGDKTTSLYGTDSIAFGGMLKGW